MQTQSAPALPKTAGKKRIEDARQVVTGYAMSVVGHSDMHALCVQLRGSDGNQARCHTLEPVNQGIAGQVGDDLTKRPGKTVHLDAGRNLDHDAMGCPFELRP